MQSLLADSSTEESQAFLVIFSLSLHLRPGPLQCSRHHDRSFPPLARNSSHRCAPQASSCHAIHDFIDLLQWGT